MRGLLKRLLGLPFSGALLLYILRNIRGKKKMEKVRKKKIS
jgi:hypothetical protein